MKSKHRILSILLSLAIVIGMTPGITFAGQMNSGQTKTIVLSCSDFQEPTSTRSGGNYAEGMKKITDILSTMKASSNGFSAIDGVLGCGDYSWESSDNSKGVGYFKQAFNSKYSNIDFVLCQGNHDNSTTSGLAAFGNNDQDEYGVFVLNEDNYPEKQTSYQKSTVQTTANALDSYLDKKAEDGYTKPIFVISHVPLHFSTRTTKSGDGLYAKMIHDVLYDHGDDLTIVFLYGHNHAHGNDDYQGAAAQFLSTSDSITTNDKIAIAKQNDSTRKTYDMLDVNYTYMNAGYIGYYWESWVSSGTGNLPGEGVDGTLTMTSFEITDTDLVIKRWDADGLHNLKSEGAAGKGDQGSDLVSPYAGTVASPVTIPLKTGSEQTEGNAFKEVTSNGVTISGAFTSATATPKSTVTEAENAGITSYTAYDIDVEGLVGDATVTMPVLSTYNGVWHVNNGQLEKVSGAEFSNGHVTFTANSFSDYLAGEEPGSIPEYRGTDVTKTINTNTAYKENKENYFDIDLKAAIPDDEAQAVSLVLDLSSSMYTFCANCGCPKNNHNGTVHDITINTGFEGGSVTETCCKEYVERIGMCKEQAETFLTDLRSQVLKNGKPCYVEIIGFWSSAQNYQSYVDISDETNYQKLITAVRGLPENKSGTNLSLGMQMAYNDLASITNDSTKHVSGNNTYMVLLSDGVPTSNKGEAYVQVADAVTSDYIDKWKNIWSGYGHFKWHEDGYNSSVSGGKEYHPEQVMVGPYYAEQLREMGGKLYSVVFGQNIDQNSWQSANNYKYVPLCGLDNKDYIASFSNESVFTTDGEGLHNFYSNVIDALSVDVSDAVVTDLMSDWVEFISFIDSDGQPVEGNTYHGAVYDPDEEELTWVVRDENGTNENVSYRVRLKNEISGFKSYVEGDTTTLFPTNGTTQVEYTMYVDGEEVHDTVDIEVPEAHGFLADVSFTKKDAENNPLPGAKFTLTHDADNCTECTNFGTEWGDDDLTYTAISDDNGVVTFEDVPSGHNYILTETEAPAGYAAAEDSAIDIIYGKVKVNGENLSADYTVVDPKEPYLVYDYGVENEYSPDEFLTADEQSLLSGGKLALKSLTADEGEQIRLDDDNNILYTAKTINQGIKAKLTLQETGKSAYTKNITIVPASNVYYEAEDSYITNVNANSDWKTAGTNSEFRAADNDTSVYGATDPDYDEDGFSNGQAYYAEMSLDGNKFASTSDMLSFTFKGTGFDIISECGTNTGIVLAAVKNSEDEYVKSYLCDTYFCGDDKKMDGSDSSKIITGDGIIDYQVPIIRNMGLDYDEYTVEIYGYLNTGSGVITAKNAMMKNAMLSAAQEEIVEDALEQCEIEGVDAEDVEVEYFDDNSILAGGTGVEPEEPGLGAKIKGMLLGAAAAPAADAYSYIDAVRIYKPLEKADENRYYADNEKNVRYSSIYDEIMKSASSVEGTDYAGMTYVEYDGNNEFSKLGDYKVQGPENEVYLAKNQFVAAVLDGYKPGDTVMVSAMSVQGSSTMTVLNGTSEPESIAVGSSANEKYFDLSDYIFEDEDLGYVLALGNGSADDTSVLSVSGIKMTAPITLRSNMMLKSALSKSLLNTPEPVVEEEPSVADTPAPKNVTAEAGKTTLTIKWDEVEGAAAYDVAYKRASAKNYTHVSVASGKTSKKLTKLDTSTKYNVKVAVSDAEGGEFGAYSKVKTITTKKDVPSKVTISSVKAGKKSLTVKWKKVSGASGYKIAYKKASSKKWHYKTVSSKYLSKKLTKLSKNKKYNVKVKAYKYVKKDGKKVKSYGSYSKTKTVKVK